MFDRDIKWYKPTPRSMQESKWEPYSKLDSIAKPAWRDALDLCLAVGIAAAVGLMLAWGI